MTGVLVQIVPLFLLGILPTASFQHLLSTQCHRTIPLRMSGYGIAEGYTWKEEGLEIEVTVPLPPGVTGKDVHFEPGPTSLHLSVATPDGKRRVLLDGDRKLRGRISLDGTFWVFSDRRRSITVTLEKYFPHSAYQMQILDFDWKGIYPKDDDEVTERKYDQPEVLNVREYAASLGVDIDNINRSMVDETMFSSGLNLTQSTLDQLMEHGYLAEVTQQKDGTEYRTNPVTGEAEPFSFQNDAKPSSLGNQNRVNIPFLDSNSPWNSAVPVSRDPVTNRTTIADEELLKQGLKQHADAFKEKDTATEDQEEMAATPNRNTLSDPIELLTVKKLQDILRKQGLKTSGSKKELQNRIRSHVDSLLRAPSTGNE